MTRRPRLMFSIIVLLVIGGPVSAQLNWEIVPPPVATTLDKIHLLNSESIWVAGEQGVLLHSSDRGVNWSPLNVGTERNIIDVFFLNDTLGWALTWVDVPFFTMIHQTTDGGETWAEETYPEENILMTHLTFFDEMHGWMAGISGTIVNTEDGGITWTRAHIDTVAFAFLNVFNLHFYDNKYAFAAGGNYDFAGVVWRTIDYGQNWTPQGLGPEPIFSLHFIDSLNVIGVGGDFEFGTNTVRTTDGGETWEYTLMEIFGIGTAITGRTGSELWAALSLGGSFMVSYDTGETWTEMSTPNGLGVNDLIFADSTFGVAVGANGNILRYDNPTVDLVADASLPDRFELRQNYPNPFNPATVIGYSLFSSGFVELEIYDLSGARVKTAINGQRSTGSYEYIWDGTNDAGESVASGIYFYRLTANGLARTKKMMLMR